MYGAIFILAKCLRVPDTTGKMQETDVYRMYTIPQSRLHFPVDLTDCSFTGFRSTLIVFHQQKGMRCIFQ